MMAERYTMPTPLTTLGDAGLQYSGSPPHRGEQSGVKYGIA